MNERYGNVTTTGEIRILGKNIYDPDVSLTALRRSVGMVFPASQPAADLDLRERAVRPARGTRRGVAFSRREEQALGQNRPCATCNSGTTSRTGFATGPRASRSSSSRNCASPGCCR